MSAAGTTSEQVESTFMIKPQMPVSLAVSISMSESTMEMPTPAMGP